MPIYSYKCRSSKMKPTGKKKKAGGETFEEIKSCGHEFEVFYTSQGAVEREEPTEVCPKCGSKKKKRLVSTGTSFVLKGSGWAKDRYGG